MRYYTPSPLRKGARPTLSPSRVQWTLFLTLLIHPFLLTPFPCTSLLPQPSTQSRPPSNSILVNSKSLRHRFARLSECRPRSFISDLSQRRKVASYSKNDGTGFGQACQGVVFDAEERGFGVEV